MLVAISTRVAFQDIMDAWFCIPRTCLENHREPGMVQLWEVTCLTYGQLVFCFPCGGPRGANAAEGNKDSALVLRISLQKLYSHFILHVFLRAHLQFLIVLSSSPTGLPSSPRRRATQRIFPMASYVPCFHFGYPPKMVRDLIFTCT